MDISQRNLSKKIPEGSSVAPGLHALWRKIVALGGEPATGKTTVVRKLIEQLETRGAFKKFDYGLLRGHCHEAERIVILGIYSPTETFAGTDRLSMAVMKDAVGFLSRARQLGLKDYSIVFEGDRLFSSAFLKQCKLVAPTDIVIVKADALTLKRRHMQRGDSQTEAWLRSRVTKIDNISKSFSDVEYVENETRDAIETIANDVLRKLGAQGFGGN